MVSVEEACCVEISSVGVVGFVLEMEGLMVIVIGMIGDGLHENMQIWNEIQ